MRDISILDCTLRDGGYCNQWKFGKKNIVRIASSLAEAGIDIIECGYLKENPYYDGETTCYTDIEQISNVLSSKRKTNKYVVMINYGEYDVEKLPECFKTGIDGIRLAFHKADIKKVVDVSKIILGKGYLLFWQPMITLLYSGEELSELINYCNELSLYAMYIVDSFGVMKRSELLRLFSLFDGKLNSSIHIGFHSHNNMQLSYSNAQTLVDIEKKHRIIVDTCVYGMGRGAGNLNTELFTEYLNENCDFNYQLSPILSVIDEIIDNFYHSEHWGYSLPNYLSAVHNTHPNYASFLCEKHTLTYKEMDDILTLMTDDKRVYYDKEYIEKLYLQYLSKENEFKKPSYDFINGKDVLIIAPGKSSVEEKDKILAFLKSEKVISVSINFDYSVFRTDYIFVSNLRRYESINSESRRRCIVTSNIVDNDVCMKIEYSELLNNQEYVQDNAGLMAINFFCSYGAKTIYIAGMDGYSHDMKDNFCKDEMVFAAKSEILDRMNTGMRKVLDEYRKKSEIVFLTNTIL